MRCSDVIDVVVITRRHVGGILSVNKTRSRMQKSENSYANVIRRPCFCDRLIIPHSTVSKHTHIYDVTLLQQVYLQHGGGS